MALPLSLTRNVTSWSLTLLAALAKQMKTSLTCKRVVQYEQVGSGEGRLLAKVNVSLFSIIALLTLPSVSRHRWYNFLHWHAAPPYCASSSLCLLSTSQLEPGDWPSSANSPRKLAASVLIILCRAWRPFERQG